MHCTLLGSFALMAATSIFSTYAQPLGGSPRLASAPCDVGPSGDLTMGYTKDILTAKPGKDTTTYFGPGSGGTSYAAFFFKQGTPILKAKKGQLGTHIFVIKLKQGELSYSLPGDTARDAVCSPTAVDPHYNDITSVTVYTSK